MSNKNRNIIIKFESYNKQTVGQITKINGLMKAKYLISVINNLNLDANPRSSRTGSVTNAIQDSIENDPKLFPMKTKGILLASSNYENLERNRIKLIPQDLRIEGILDGGHNTLAIGLYILKKAMSFKDKSLSNKSKTWEDFKILWDNNMDIINEYLYELKNEPNNSDLDFLIPIELLVPRDMNDESCINSFNNDLLEICAARNNNVQLQVSAKANQKGYFDILEKLIKKYNPNMKVEWKTNDGGDIKVQDIIALSWIPLNLVTDSEGKKIELVAPNKLYSAKGSCLNQFDKLMSSPEVTSESESNYKRALINSEVETAFEITAQLPKLYDYIYTNFPTLYNASGGSYGRINAVKKLNDKRKIKVSPFEGKPIDILSPDGFIVPLVYGLQALMENTIVDGKQQIKWIQDPMEFLEKNLAKIVSEYAGNLGQCDYDPQKVGKSPQNYKQSLAAFKMAIAGIL